MRKFAFIAAAAMLTCGLVVSDHALGRGDSDSDSDSSRRSHGDSDSDSNRNRGTDRRHFRVIITNLTRGQSFTPILVASHKKGVKLFELGDPASEELALLAESGNPEPLARKLIGMRDVKDIDTSNGLLGPGESVTLRVEASGRFDHLSVASMLIPTNDAFFALNGVPGPRDRDSRVFVAPAYDAGSETNDELCSSIPGPVCGGQGPSPDDDGEGFVHIHAGIHDIGDLEASERDWRNPVARIRIERMRRRASRAHGG